MTGKKFWMIGVLYLSLAGLLLNCGSAENSRDEVIIVQPPDGLIGDFVPENRLETQDQYVKDRESDAPAEARYVTKISASTNCPNRELEFAVAKNHEDFSRCERVVLTAQGNHADLFDGELDFLWFVLDKNAIGLECPAEYASSLCQLKGNLDVFDADDGLEPQSTIVACAMNDCQEVDGDDCEDLVCTAISVSSIFNLEGGWKIQSPLLDEDLIMIPYQDGRRFEDQDLFIIRGMINGTNISFYRDGFIFSGSIVSPTYLHGTILNSTDMSVIGEWSALRLS